MAEPALQQNDILTSPATPKIAPAPKTSEILVYVDAEMGSRKVIPHARAIAKAMDGELTLVEAISSRRSGDGPVDPIGWSIRLREAQARVAFLAQTFGQVDKLATEVLVGEVAERISQLVSEKTVGFTALCTHGVGANSDWELGNTARRIVETVPGAMLMVPASIDEETSVDYRRIMVPLDGSSRAESVLPVAIKIARMHGAELLLVHAISKPEISKTGPIDAKCARLLSDLNNHNERTGHDYLDMVRRRIVDYDLSVRTMLIGGGDIRRQLVQACDDEGVELLVIAAHGHRSHSDVPFGDVAAHLIARSRVPIFMMRDRSRQLLDRFGKETESAESRLPGQSV